MSNILTYMRVLGCTLIVTAHFVMLYVGVTSGAVIHLIADLLCMPFFIKTKAWDMVIMLCFLLVIGVSKLWNPILMSSF